MTQNNKPEVGKVYEGKVKNMLNFGAFVEILPGVEGLVHISKMAPVRISQPEDILEVGAIIDVKCIEYTKDTLRLTMLDVEQLNEKVANRILRAIQRGDAPAPKRDDKKPRRNFKDRPGRKFENKPGRSKDRNERPGRSNEERPKHSSSDRSRNDRTKRNFSDKPGGNRNNKPHRNNSKPSRGFGNKPASKR